MRSSQQVHPYPSVTLLLVIIAGRLQLGWESWFYDGAIGETLIIETTAEWDTILFLYDSDGEMIISMMMSTICPTTTAASP
jgi:hypothetical protein